LLISSSSRFVLLFHSPFSYLGPYILLNIFLSKTRTACSSYFVIVHASAPYDTTGLISVLHNKILVALDKSLPLKSFSYPAHKIHAPYYIVHCGLSVSTKFFHIIS
jgi:hypothetical protein